MANVWNVAKQRWEDPENNNVLVGGQPGQNGTWEGGVWTNQQGGQYINNVWQQPPNALYEAQGAQLGAQQAQIGAKQQTLASQQAEMPFAQASLNAKRGVLASQAGTFGPKAQVIQANRGVQAAQGAQLAGTRGFIGQQQQENTTQRGEFEREQTAKTNVADQAAVATMARYRAAEDARNRTLGITPSVDVNAPPGTVRLGEDIAPGVRAKLTTQYEDVQQANAANKTRRGFDMESARLAVQLMGTDVDQARMVAAQAGFTLDEAQLAVEQAQNQAGFAGSNEDQAQLGTKQASLNEAGVDLQASQADLNTRVAGRAPFAGAEKYRDPKTGMETWMTPSEKDNLDYQYKLELETSRTTSDYAAKVNRENIGKLLTGEGGFNQNAAPGPLSALSTDALLNLYQNPAYYTARGIGGFNTAGREAFEKALEMTIAQKLKANKNSGYTDETALSAARQLILAEVATRPQPKRPGGGGNDAP